MTVLLLGLVALLLLAGPVSRAAAGEVYWDPGTPAGKEYVIPHEQARSLGERGGASRKRGHELFGAGVRRARSRGPRAAVDPQPRRTRRQRRVAPAPGRPAPTRAGAVPTASGPPPLVFEGGGAAIVLLLGGIGRASVRLLARRT